jgi:hypothetical protein
VPARQPKLQPAPDVGPNLVLLGFIGLIPLPTSQLGDHGDQPSVVIL